MRRFAALILPIPAIAALLALRPHRAPACDPDNGGLTLPKGFCATLFATATGVRHLTVAPNGDVFAGGTGQRRGVSVFRDVNGDGHSDSTVTFGAGYGTGTGIQLGPDAIYFSPNATVIRFAWRPGSMTPSDTGTVIVSGMPTGGHTAKTLALGKDGSLFVDHGSATNSCQVQDRAKESAGQNPCAELAIRAGIWRYDAKGTAQTPSTDKRWATGLRNMMAIAVDPNTGTLWGATHGRDNLSSSWGFSDTDNAEKPAEEFGRVDKGIDFGWPYCYFDPIAKKKVQAPEYGGDGIKPGDCGAKTQPVIGFPGHWAPMQLAILPARNAFGAEYASGAFLAFHGSWNRAPLPQAGSRVVFIPFRNGQAVGTYTTFASIAGREATGTAWHPAGVAVAPDGSALYIGSDGDGKIWRIVRTQ